MRQAFNSAGWIVAMMLAAVLAQAEEPKPDTRPTLFVVSNAHLDTQWLWTIQDSIRECIPATMRDNFARFRQTPSYVFNFEGSFRYRLMQEYYPKDFARLQAFAKQGRWHVSGSSVDAGDVNIPHPESLIRHVLYGNRFYRETLGQEATDIFLPDCFGFGWALPTVAKHCGLTGFSTQKLTWGSSVGIPFDIGRWRGVDGSEIVAALDPGEYVSKIRSDLSHDAEWLAKANRTGEKSGAFFAYRYFGTGDRGGAPDAESVSWLAKSMAGTGPLRVVAARSADMYSMLTPEQIAALPEWGTELLMTRHGVGCYTSVASMKRLNRRNEQLSAAAEPVALAASWLGGVEYPGALLRESWERFLWHHHHDDLTGTSTPLAYPYSWNDEILSAKSFAQVLTSSVGSVSRALDTTSEGIPLVVFNSISIVREDVVAASVRYNGEAPANIRVFGPDGREVPSQIVSRDAQRLDLLFLAAVAPLGFGVFDVRASEEPCDLDTGLIVDATMLQNDRYRVRIDANGDVSGVLDLATDRELLKSPLLWQMFEDKSSAWPQWEILYQDLERGPRQIVEGPARVRVVESGPVRVTLEISRQAAGSWFTQRVSLSAGGAADVVRVDNEVDWHSRRTLLKAAFPLAARAPTATYDLGIGTIRRGNNSEKLYEVPAQQWADVTTEDGSHGVAILSDCRAGWDKPADDVLRLSLIHSPLEVQVDFGAHRFAYGITGHAGDWRDGDVPNLGARFNAPLSAFQVAAHQGALGRTWSLGSLGDPGVRMLALKKAEDSNEIVVRVVDLTGRTHRGVRLQLFAPIVAAREITGQETPATGSVALSDGDLVLDLEPYRPRSIAVELGAPMASLLGSSSRELELAYDSDVVSLAREVRGGDFDGSGHALPGELLPETVTSDDVTFELGPTKRSAKNAVTCRGQSLQWDERFGSLNLLLAASGGDVDATFVVNGRSVPVRIADYTDYVGQSSSLVIDGDIVEATQLEEPYLKPQRVAWIGTHRHDAKGQDDPYVFTYLFHERLPLPGGGGPVELVLPNEPRIKVLAASLSQDLNACALPASELLDEVVTPRIRPKGGLCLDPVSVTLSCDTPGAIVRYTLDGSDPTLESPVAGNAIRVESDATVRARAFFGTRAASGIASRTFKFTTLRPATAPPASSSPGLLVESFEGEWRTLAEMEAAGVVKTGVARTIDVKPVTRQLNCGLRHSGRLKIPTDGIYTFTTRSDDGSRLWIDGDLVVDNDGLHGATQRSGQVALASGFHAIRTEFFQRGGDIEFSVTWAFTGEPAGPIPASALFR